MIYSWLLITFQHTHSLHFTSLHFTSLSGATTHAGSWPTQKVASNHLYPWPCSSNFWLPASLHPSSLHPSIWGLAFPLASCTSGLSKVIFLHGRLSCIRTICPAHLSLVILIVVTKSVSSYRRSFQHTVQEIYPHTWARVRVCVYASYVAGTNVWSQNKPIISTRKRSVKRFVGKTAFSNKYRTRRPISDHVTMHWRKLTAPVT